MILPESGFGPQATRSEKRTHNGYNTTKSRLRTLTKALARIAVLSITMAAVAYCGARWSNAIVMRNGGARLYADVRSVPPAPVAIVFGAGYQGNALSRILDDRVRTGVALYKAGKAAKLLMSGDNGSVGYNEPDAMKEAAVRMGVPAKNVLCDYAGFRTYDTLYRARDIFGVRRAILVTQTYHLHRALYTATKLGLIVTGVAADRHDYYIGQDWFHRREFISRATAWIDVNVTHPRPKYLGPRVADLGG